jgi:hypothetical protein
MKPPAGNPPGRRQKEQTMPKHRLLLPWIMVIVTVKVKITVRPR